MHPDGVDRKMWKNKKGAGCRNTTCLFFALHINNWSSGPILIYNILPGLVLTNEEMCHKIVRKRTNATELFASE